MIKTSRYIMLKKKINDDKSILFCNHQIHDHITFTRSLKYCDIFTVKLISISFLITFLLRGENLSLTSHSINNFLNVLYDDIISKYGLQLIESDDGSLNATRSES